MRAVAILGLCLSLASGTTTLIKTTRTRPPGTTGVATSSTTPTYTPCPPDPAKFHIGDDHGHKYSIDLPGTGQLHETTAASTSIFWIASVCYNPNICGVSQLSYNYTCSSTGKRITYGAYIESYAGGPITFIANQTEALAAGYSIVTAGGSGATCGNLVLIPFLNHDTSAEYDCNGTLGLYGDQPSGCLKVEPTFNAA